MLVLVAVAIASTASQAMSEELSSGGWHAIEQCDNLAATRSFEDAFLAGEFSTSDPELGLLMGCLATSYLSAAQFEKSWRTIDLWTKVLALNRNEPWAREQRAARDRILVLFNRMVREQRDLQAFESKPQTGSFAVHLSSERSLEQANDEWRRLAQLFPTLLNDRSLITQEIFLDEQGDFVRVIAGRFEQRSEARDLCVQLEQRGQYCKVLTPADKP